MTGRGRVLFFSLWFFLLVWGAYLRVWNLAERPFWGDEAWVASAVTHQSSGELLQQTELPLPPLFAVTTKLLGSIVSPAELGLRLLPLICGIACIPLSYLVLRTLRVPRTICLTAMALCASSLMLVLWSRELKQYHVEAFVSVLLALLVFRFQRCPVPRRRRLIGLGIVLTCLFGPWFGYATVFPAATLIAVLILLRPVEPRRRESVIVGLIGLAGLIISTGTVLEVAAQEQASHASLVKFISHWYIDLFGARDWLRAAAYAASSTEMVFFPGVETINVENSLWIGLAAAVLWILAMVGLWCWPGRGRREMACWVLVPWLLMLFAAVAHRYPFASPRMMVFWAAPFVLAVAAGLVRIVRGCSVIFLGRGAPGLVAGLILALAPATYVINVPTRHAYGVHYDFPAMLSTLQGQRKPGELVVVAILASPPVRFYEHGQFGTIIYMPTESGTLYVEDCDYDGLITEAVRLAGPRWWVLTTTAPTFDRTRDKLLKMAERRGYKIEVYAEGTTRGMYGAAQLLMLTRQSHRW